jgi:hypothetical protein
MVKHEPENPVLLEPSCYGVGDLEMVPVTHNVLTAPMWFVIAPLLEVLLELDPRNIQMVQATALPGKEVTRRKES